MQQSDSSHTHLRVFQAGDTEAVRELIHSTIKACYRGIYPTRAVEYFLDYHRETEILRRAERGTTLVAEAGGRIVGTGTLKWQYILAVFVRRELQGRGLGRNIMEALEKRARADGLEEIWLDVSLPSRPFYERLGYVGFEPAFLDVGDGQRLDYWKASKLLAGGKSGLDARPVTIAERKFAQARGQLRGRSIAEVFEFIHQTNLWNSEQSRSGVGSEPEATGSIRRQLPRLLKRLEVQTLLDIPCGDFSWMSQTDLPIRHYIGGDIVPAIIEQNQTRYAQSHPEAEFRVLDLTADPLPKADAALCRDCLVHLPYAAIDKALRNLCAGSVRYVILTTFVGKRVNGDIETGDWRPLNFQLPPFGFPAPMAVLNEGCTEENGAYADKSLGVWTVEQIASRL